MFACTHCVSIYKKLHLSAMYFPAAFISRCHKRTAARYNSNKTKDTIAAKPKHLGKNTHCAEAEGSELAQLWREHQCLFDKK